MSTKIARIKKYPIKTKRPNTFKISDSQKIVTHDPSKCAGTFCCIHNPSNHHMRDWVMLWRNDKGVMERICPLHGVGHPDPDDAAFNVRMGRGVLNTHGCCGCCSGKQLRHALIDI
jgi:hypothetical protein